MLAKSATFAPRNTILLPVHSQTTKKEIYHQPILDDTTGFVVCGGSPLGTMKAASFLVRQRRWPSFSSTLSNSTPRTNAKQNLSRRPLSSAIPDKKGVFQNKNPIVAELWASREAAKKMIGSESPYSLEGKHPSESRVEVFYPFADDEMLRATYENPWGQLRFGRVLEDMDALAGNISFLHVGSPNPVIVTASVDRIRLTKRPHISQSQKLSGQVTWTGTSSLEIQMQYESEGEVWLEAHVTFVVLDRETHRPTKIPPILPESDLERQYFAAGAKRAAQKKAVRKAQKTPQASQEVEQEARELLQKANPLLTMPSLADPYAILMEKTKLQIAEIAQPQVQNLHNRIFGGYLMRRAFELAFSTAYVFGGARPIFLEVDTIEFLAPVDVGDLLVFNSRVLYTDTGKVEDYLEHMTTHCVIEMRGPEEAQDHPVRDDELLPLVHVEVETWVTEPEKATARLSNQFYFTFAIVRKSPIRHVLPGTQDEARRMVLRKKSDEEQAAADNYEI